MRIPVKSDQRDGPNLTVLSYGNPLPKLQKWPLWVQRLAFKRIVNAIKRELRSQVDLVWSFDLSRFPDLAQWNPAHTILHLVELFDHPLFESDHPHRRDILNSSDTVLSIADLITDQVYELREDVLQINHGADILGFQRAKSIAELGLALPGKNGIKAGFVGNFQVSFDFEILLQLARENRDVDFILIGPHSGQSNLGKLHPDAAKGLTSVREENNIYLIGTVPSDLVISYLLELDISLILYQNAFWQGHCNPHKLMAYFYAGNPIVSSYIDQYRDRPDLITMVKNNADFCRTFTQVKQDLDALSTASEKKRRRSFAQEHDYRELIKRVLAVSLG